MKYQILAVGLKKDMLNHCRECFAKSSVELKNVISISEAVRILEREAPQLLVLDMEHIRSIGQSDWITNIRYVSFIPIIVLSDIPVEDVSATIKSGADICYDSKLSPPVIALLLSAQLRRITEHNHFRVSEICETPEGTEIVLTDVNPKELARFNETRCPAVPIHPKAGMAGMAACLATTSFAYNGTPAQPQIQAMGAARRDPRRGEIPGVCASTVQFVRPSLGK